MNKKKAEPEKKIDSKKVDAPVKESQFKKKEKN